MRLQKILLSAGLAVGVFAAAAPAQAQPRGRDACLISARISGYNAIDDRTLIVTDTSRNRYRVRLSGVCHGLSGPRMAISIRTPSRLTCIGSGDRVHFRDSLYGRQRCFVRSVQFIGRPDRRDWDRRDYDYDRRWDDREGRYR